MLSIYNSKNRRKYLLKVHIVLVTKYRKNIFFKDVISDIKSEINRICIQKNYFVYAMELDINHIHILIGYDCTDRVSDIVKYIKQMTISFLWKNYPDYLRTVYWGNHHYLWSDGYFACSIGDVSYSVIKKYIEEQG